MEKDTKLLLGKLLGEVFRIQRSLPGMACASSDAEIYALLNGFDGATDQILESMGGITEEKVKAVMDTLDPIWTDEKRLKEFKGFYDIEPDLQRLGVDRSDAISILTYLKANHQFTTIIDKMDSSNSPGECRRFEISEWDR